MNETKRSSFAAATTMSRRGSVKAAAAAGAVGVAAGGMATAGSWLAPTEALAELGTVPCYDAIHSWSCFSLMGRFPDRSICSVGRSEA